MTLRLGSFCIYVSFLICVPLVVAQDPARQEGRSTKSIEDLMNRKPPAAASIEDIRPLGFWFATLTPHDYTANRELVRRVASYIATVELASSDPQLRFFARRINRQLPWLGIGCSPCVVPWASQDAPPPETPGGPEPAYVPEPPPFEREAPVIEDLAEADRQTARELQNRYEAAVSQATTAWQSAEAIRRSLMAKKMELNVQTEVALTRLRLYLDTAASSLRNKDWAEARLGLERAEYQAGKVFAAVGR